MSLKTMVAAVGLAGSLLFGLGGAAQASVVYTLSVDHCSAGCGPAPYGTVTLSKDADGVGIDVLVNVLPNSFTNTGLHGFTFDLTGGPDITLKNLTSGFSFLNAGGAPGSFMQDGFGKWQYALDWTLSNGGDSGVHQLAFEILGAGTDLGVFASVFDKTDNENIFFTADIWSKATGATGPVGAPGPGVPGVPEPAAWLLMIGGIAFVGYALRRQPANAAVMA